MHEAEELKMHHIPEENIPLLQERIDQLNKKAKKLNCKPIEIITHRYEDKKITGINGNFTGEIQRYIIIEIIGISPSLSDWQFIASIESREAGNVIRSIPGVEIPVKYRESWSCDHCKTDRKRVYTYLVKNLKTQEIKQVGKSCIKDFLGHANPQMIANWFESIISLEDEMEGWSIPGQWTSNRTDIKEYLSFVAACIREYGWTSKTTAKEYEGLIATSNRAMDELNLYYKPMKDRYGNKIEAIQRIKNDFEIAEKSLTWAKELTKEQTDNNDYLYNINILAQEKSVKGKDRGFVASIVSSYAKTLESEIKKEQQQKLKAISDYIGSPGQKIELVLNFITEFSFEGMYGTTWIYKFADENNNTIVWKTSKALMLEEGEELKLKGTIKEHNEYRGEKQTILTRCKVIAG